MGECQDARHLKVWLQAGTRAGSGLEGQRVVRLGGREAVVAKVVDDGAGALGGEADVELGEKGDERRGCRRR